MMPCLYNNLEATGRRVFATAEPAKQLSRKNVVSVVRINSHCKEEVAGYVQQKSPWLYQNFCLCPIAL